MNDQQLRHILTHRTIGVERLQRNAAILLPMVEVNGEDALLFEVRSKRLEMQTGGDLLPRRPHRVRRDPGDGSPAGAVGGVARPVPAGDPVGTHG